MLDGGNTKAVEDFPCPGLLITSSGRMDKDFDRRIALASRAFGILHKSVFLHKNLSLAIRRRPKHVFLAGFLNPSQSMGQEEDGSL